MNPESIDSITEEAIKVCTQNYISELSKLGNVECVGVAIKGIYNISLIRNQAPKTIIGQTETPFQVTIVA